MPIKHSGKQWIRRATLPAVFALGAVASMNYRSNATGASTPIAPPAQAIEIQSAFEQVADKLRPSVVFIESVKVRTVAQSPNGSPFGFQFPGQPGGGGQESPQFRAPQLRGTATGSGVIVRQDGYIITNDHVVQGAERVKVKLYDGRTFTGKVFRDFRSDLAVIKIDATGLPAAELADSDKARVGQWAVAFGSPFGLSDTMTVGIVSSLHRNTSIGRGAEGRYYSSLIQTDASINPGNSGGPLVDLYGRVVGVNVAIESPSGGSVGIGFAIPANTAKYVIEQLISNGKVTRGYFGLTPKTLEYEDRGRYGVEKGALVTSLAQNSPAEKAGLQLEDVITAFNGKSVEGEVDLRDAISRTKPNTPVTLQVRRDGEAKTLQATVGAIPEELAQGEKAPMITPTDASKGKLGIAVGDLDEPEVKALLKKETGAKRGAVVIEVKVGSPASEAGLQTGDVILRLDGKAIANAEQLMSVAKGLKSGTVRAAILRDSQTVLIEMELE